MQKNKPSSQHFMFFLLWRFSWPKTSPPEALWPQRARPRRGRAPETPPHGDAKTGPETRNAPRFVWVGLWGFVKKLGFSSYSFRWFKMVEDGLRYVIYCFVLFWYVLIYVSWFSLFQEKEDWWLLKQSTISHVLLSQYEGTSQRLARRCCGGSRSATNELPAGYSSWPELCEVNVRWTIQSIHSFGWSSNKSIGSQKKATS